MIAAACSWPCGWLDWANAAAFLALLCLCCGGALAEARRRAGVALSRAACALTLWRILHRPWRIAWRQARRLHPWSAE